MLCTLAVLPLQKKQLMKKTPPNQVYLSAIKHNFWNKMSEYWKYSLPILSSIWFTYQCQLCLKVVFKRMILPLVSWNFLYIMHGLFSLTQYLKSIEWFVNWTLKLNKTLKSQQPKLFSSFNSAVSLNTINAGTFSGKQGLLS